MKQDIHKVLATNKKYYFKNARELIFPLIDSTL